MTLSAAEQIRAVRVCHRVIQDERWSYNAHLRARKPIDAHPFYDACQVVGNPLWEEVRDEVVKELLEKGDDASVMPQ